MADKCFICNNINTIITGVEKGKDCQCPHCGNYKYFSDSGFVDELDKEYREKLSSYVFYHKKHLGKGFYIGDFEDDVSPYPHITKEMVESWYPERFADKVDLILLKLQELSKYDGAPIYIEDDVLFIPCETRNSSESAFRRRYYIDFLESQGYLEHIMGSHTHILTPKSIERIYELQKTNSTNKDVFVSMAFNNGTKDTREAIRSGIDKAGFSSKFIDEIIHNHQIMPEMFRLIRECRFLVLEISDPNYGAYYEAGYALGLGKEVIICCSKEVFEKKYETEEEQKYEKYLKPHFDIAQKQILVWNNYEDLTKKLSEWIKALF